MKYFQIILVTFFGMLSVKAGTAVQAEAIVQEHKVVMNAWRNELAGAQSMEVMRQVMEKKPKIEEYKKRMIAVVGAELKNGWALKYGGWLLVNVPLGNKDVKFILDYANKFHMNGSDIGDFCYNMTLSKQTVQAKKLFIEKAYKKIKDPKQKAITGISLSIVLSEMGDNAVNNARILSLVRQAIIDGADVKVGESNVGAIGMEMVYRLKNLRKGRQAPAISGVDSSGKPVSLAQYKGKVVMLVFWSSFDLSVEKTVELLALMRKVEKLYAGKKFVLVGVNKDQIGNLRELEKESQTSSKNISDPQQKIFKEYRVGEPPHCYVIDQQGRIQFSGVIGSFATLTVDALLNPVKPKKLAPAKP